MNDHGFSLQGKTILVTGASSGLGRACAVAAASLGAQVILNGRDEARLSETLASLPAATDRAHLAILADLSHAQGREHLLAQAPAIDGAVLAAGIHRIKPSKFATMASLEETFSVNYTAPYLLTAALLKAGKTNQGGSLVYIGSIAIDSAAVGNGAYAASKSALLASVRILALEVARQRIRVNMVSPGQVQTAMVEKNAEQLTAEALAQNEAAYPLGSGSPQDVANAALFLLSPLSSWITGHNLVVDGGYTLR